MGNSFEIDVAKKMLSAFEDELIDRMNEPFKRYLRRCLLESISPVIRIQKSGLSISINRDDYGYNDIIRFILNNMDDNTSVIIDGTDVLYWD